MRLRILLLLTSSSLLAAPLAWSIPSATLDDAGSAPRAAPAAPDTKAYSDALALMKQGDALTDQAAAKEAYASARTKLQSLVGRSPQFAEAWNALGYTQRKLGSLDVLQCFLPSHLFR